MALTILPGDFTDPQVLALLRAHVTEMHAGSPPGFAFALDTSALQTPDITFFAVWDGDAVVGIGALRELDAAHCELKSMRTHADHLRKGVATALLDHLLSLARARGYRRVSLETGSAAAFEPALALYRCYGFVNGDPCGDYPPSTWNQFLHLDL